MLILHGVLSRAYSLNEYEAMPIVEMPSDEGNSVSVDHVIPAPTKANQYTKSYYR